MARVFKHTHGKAGEIQKTKNWYTEFKTHDGRRKRVPGYADKKLTEELGRKLERLASMRAVQMPLDADTLRWIEGLPKKLRANLVKWGMIDGRSASQMQPLSDHLADFRRSLMDRTEPEHAQLVADRAERIVTACGFVFYSDISRDLVERYLADRRAGVGDEGSIGHQTHNFYVQAIKQFCKWMVDSDRATENAARNIRRVKVTDKDERRALTDAELQKLITTAAAGPVRYRFDGRSRAMLYLAATYTGLRASELAVLTPKNFDLSGEVPTVTIKAADEKARRGAVLPLHPTLHAELREWIEHFDADDRLWPGRWAENRYGNKLIKFDLEAAEIPFRTDAGKIDFHALRHTFCTRLANSGATTREVMDLARHTTAAMSMRYTHATMYDLASAIGAVPDVRPSDHRSEPQQAKATGTDDVRPKILSTILPKRGATTCNNLQHTNSGDDDDEPSESDGGLTPNPKNSNISLDRSRDCDLSGEMTERPNVPVSKTGEESIEDSPEPLATIRFPVANSFPPDATLVTGLAKPTFADSDLQRIVAAWPNLSPADKKAIIGVIDSVAADV